MKKILIFIGVVVFLGLAYWLISPIWRVKEANDAFPTGEEVNTDLGQANDNISILVHAEAPFVAQAHEVAGKAVLLETATGKVLRFEDFETINGPDLRIYLATDTTASDFIDLGPIKGTKGNVNYELPSDTDTSKYDTVLVWCRAFSILFSYAEF